MNAGMVERAQGCLLGQLAGDALGSQVEFKSAKEIALLYPGGVRDLRDGGTWDTLAGQPTDDSEMALLLARMLARTGRYDAAEAFSQYLFWMKSGPFDMGLTISGALHGRTSLASQANGALMRISPLGIFGARLELKSVAKMAEADASLTHPNPICLQANALFTLAIAAAIRMPTSPQALYERICGWSKELGCTQEIHEWIVAAEDMPPSEYEHQQGWVRIAFGNALYRLLHATHMEEGIVDTVMCGGDTDTNAAIAGALLGAVHGIRAVPKRWLDCIRNCRPSANTRGVRRPRPEVFWPVDAMELAEALLSAARGDFEIVI
jgi:ADP-ribosylglycohydrolase